jgi:CDP-diacylglycerol--glycerol-3-phosphate 3-phosphatidyltransferase
MPATEHGNTPVAAPAPASTPRDARGSPWNVPNIITLSRLGLAVVLFCLIDSGAHWLASAVVFAIAAGTDAVDGYIARRYGLITVMGRILDPFADKIIIGGAFVFLANEARSGVNAWMVITVLGREMFVTSLRSFLESAGRDFSATWSGKIKMIVQCAAVFYVLLYLEYAPEGEAGIWKIARDVLLWGTVAVTLHSGYVYVVRAIGMFRQK